MFAIDFKLTHIAAVREQIVAIIESVNQPHVAIPGKSPQPAKGYVTGVRNSNATFSIYVYLVMSVAQETVIYANAQSQFPLEAYREIETEALNFVESMGFMMENVNFRNQPREAQDELMVRLPLFRPPTAVAMVVEESAGLDERAQNLARLLGAF